MNKKIIEKSVLKAFQTENPSIYFSDKPYSFYKKWEKKFEYDYRNLLNFPKDMFLNKTLLDFGGGTGENSVFFLNWGSKITHVEFNNKAIQIAKKVFKRYTNNRNYKFINKSLFDYKTKQKFDIVHSRGVLAHTHNKELGFQKMAKFLKPGGYIIYGDPNKSGGFQNMLQRHIVYSLSKNEEKQVKICKQLFSEDISRSKKYSYRSVDQIIYDRWIVPQQDDPSIQEVMKWFKKNNITFYSSYPRIIFPFTSDPIHYDDKFDYNIISQLSSLTEQIWMKKKFDDNYEYQRMLSPIKKINAIHVKLSNIVSSISLKKKINEKNLSNIIVKYLKGLKNLNLNRNFLDENINFFIEVQKLLKILKRKNITEIKNFIKKNKILFRGFSGVRHVDYIGVKNEN